MFKKSDSESPSTTFHTIIGDSCTIKGNIHENQSLRIDGKVIGDIVSEGSVHVGKKGEVHGNLTAHHLIISGRVEGNITASESLRINTSGILCGDVSTKVFILDEKATFNGQSKMTDSNEKPKKKPAAKQDENQQA